MKSNLIFSELTLKFASTIFPLPAKFLSSNPSVRPSCVSELNVPANKRFPVFFCSSIVKEILATSLSKYLTLCLISLIYENFLKLLIELFNK